MFSRLQWIKLAAIEMHLGGQIQKALLQEFLGRNFSSRPRRRCWWSSCVGHLAWKLPENGKVKQFGRTSSEPIFCHRAIRFPTIFVESSFRVSGELHTKSETWLHKYPFSNTIAIIFPTEKSAHWSCKIAEFSPKAGSRFHPESGKHGQVLPG